MSVEIERNKTEEKESSSYILKGPDELYFTTSPFWKISLIKRNLECQSLIDSLSSFMLLQIKKKI